MAESAAVVMERWAKGMTAAVPKIRDKIKALTSNPMHAAAAQQEKYINGVVEAAQSGKWAAGLMGVDFNDWKTKTADVGTARIAAGVESAKPKMQRFLGELLPYAEQVKQQAAQMPSATLEDRINKSVFVMREMAKFRKSGRR